MKHLNLILLAFFGLLLFSGCGESEEKKALKAKELITIKTLGLAYLEEFELEKAEAEFLKFIDRAPGDKFGYANLGLTYLRMARYPEAEKQIAKAIKIDPQDPDIRLILATVYKMEDHSEQAVSELKKALEISPGHVKVLYELTELLSTLQDNESPKERESYLLTLVHQAQGNIVPVLNLTDIYIRSQKPDSAIEQLENIKKQFPDFPKEAVEYYDKTLDYLRKSDTENAVIQFTIFHNYLKVTAPYQAGIMDLKGPGGSLIGFPLITFDQQSSLNTMDVGSIIDILKYTDVTQSSGLDIIPAGGDQFSHVEASDFDSDGDIDLYAGTFDKEASTYRHFLLSNELGRYTDITAQSGLNHTGREYGANFADYDNDGFLDLYIIHEGGNLLYRNAGKGNFENVTARAGINIAGGSKALFFDADHDGDLDLLQLMQTSNLYVRNNGDGTFSKENSDIFSPASVNSADGAFADFDEDGDIDLVLANASGGCNLYLNQRQGVFREGTENSGLKSSAGSSALDAGDYNNDGFIDLIITSMNHEGHRIYRNLQNGSFGIDEKASGSLLPAKDIRATDVSFLDFDNDGHADLLICGEPVNNTERGIFLFHNDGNGGFTDKSSALPETMPALARETALFDYNDDGDQDLVVTALTGGVNLLRNDGGSNNHFIKMKLVGLKAGSAKNNHFGIGAKVEVRSGELYQTQVVTGPDVHFGLGNRKQADVVRITWTNGVPQNIFMPNSDQALIEAQTLKGSCPFLYTWNGDQFVFAKDILWRSALGMPLGIMGGTTAYGFAEASDDYLKIPGDMLKPVKGRYSIQVTSELWEAIYFDKLELVAVDHPATTDIYVPEQFSPPPFPGRKIYHVNKKVAPVSAVNEKGDDVLPFIREEDDVYLGGFEPARYQGIVNLHELIIDPGNSIPSENCILFLHGWIFPTDASINMALSQTDQLKVQSPAVQVLDKNGRWVTVVDNPGFPMGKNKTVVTDLSGKFLSSDRRIRILTNMEIYWDHVFLGEVTTTSEPVFTPAKLISADLHYRGFSKGYRKGGRYGPHWFDYSRIDKNPRWRDLTGNYTRFGDVLPLLTGSDNKYVISNAGDEMTVEFAATGLPVLPDGWKRDFLIRSVGWVKDGDLNTAHGNTVGPLPWHGMKNYTPDRVDAYPDNPELREYNSQYNTREVNGSAYLNALKK